jgi:hypothetical protein
MSQLVLQSTTLTTPYAGTLEYDGKVPYFTPQGTQRGVVPGMQYYRLNTAVAGANATGAQNIFGVGVTLAANTVYVFETMFGLSKSAGVTSHTIGLGMGGTATSNNIAYLVQRGGSLTSYVDTGSTPVVYNQLVQTTTNTTVTGSAANAAVFQMFHIRGSISINSGGTFVPQYSLSAAPGGAYTTAAGSYFLIYPVGAAGSNTSVGTWA